MQTAATRRLAERAAEGVPDTAAEDGQWVTLQQLADEIQIPLRTLYNWRSQGHAPRGSRFGKHIRMRRRDVEAWLEAREAAGQ